jgi:hypothetical protein
VTALNLVSSLAGLLSQRLAAAAPSLKLPRTIVDSSEAPANRAAVHPGLSRAELLAILGEPATTRTCGKLEGLCYGRSPMTGDEPAVIWIRDGRVAGVTIPRTDEDLAMCSGHLWECQPEAAATAPR